MNSQIVRRLEALEESMGARDDQPRFKIEVVFIDPAGKITGAKSFSSGKAETSEASGDRKSPPARLPGCTGGF
jgi:hypothetical protein